MLPKKNYLLFGLNNLFRWGILFAPHDVQNCLWGHVYAEDMIFCMNGSPFTIHL